MWVRKMWHTLLCRRHTRLAVLDSSGKETWIHFFVENSRWSLRPRDKQSGRDVVSSAEVARQKEHSSYLRQRACPNKQGVQGAPEKGVIYPVPSLKAWWVGERTRERKGRIRGEKGEKGGDDEEQASRRARGRRCLQGTRKNVLNKGVCQRSENYGAACKREEDGGDGDGSDVRGFEQGRQRILRKRTSDGVDIRGQSRGNSNVDRADTDRGA